MTEDTFEISRRRALTALGSIGIASAGSGLGTSAYFSDEERLDGNVLTAGALDLKLDWQEHHSVWSEEEAQYASMGTPENYDYRLPGDEVGEDILIDFADEVEDARTKFMEATGLEAYPDTDDDGVQDFPTGWFGPEDDPNYICELGADTPEDLDPRGGTGLRTDNEDTVGIVDGSPQVYPLVNLYDVKPGDFGEVTFSLHLCDNPGYIWMFADNLTASENGVNEPESKDVDEDQVEGPGNPDLKDPDNDADGEKTVELLDAVQARAWYDTNGDNLKDDDEILIVDGSLREVLNGLTSDPGVKLRAPLFAGVDVQNEDGTDGTDEIPDSSPFDCTPSSELGEPSNPSCEDDDYGLPGATFDVSELPGQSTSYTTLTKEIAVDGTDYELSVEIQVTAEDDGDPQKFKFQNLQLRELPDGNFVEAGTYLVMVKGGPRANLCRPEEPTSGSGDQILESPVNRGGNVPAISHIDFCVCEIDDGDGGPGPIGEPSDCITNSNTYHVGFEWWLPVDHGNEVQTDSVTFDLGFYTEQCRHNDGSGMSRTEIESERGGRGA